MKHTILHLLNFAIILLLASCSSDPVVTTGTITGLVEDAVDNSLLQGASVSLAPGGNTTMTGTDGRFTFTDVEQGSYTLSVTKVNYINDSKTVTVSAGQTTNADFALQHAKSYLSVTPLALDFGNTDTNLSIDIKNEGHAVMQWQITENAACINCNPTKGSIQAGQQTSVTITADRSSLPKGTYTNTLVVTSSDGGSATVHFTIQVLYNNDALPSVAMLDVKGVTDVSAKFIGTIPKIGSTRVTQHGFCWHTEHNPSLQQGDHSELGPTSEPKDLFDFMVSSLKPNTTYYVRAYATNAEGTAYSSKEERFTTESTPQRPDVETGTPTRITATTAEMTGNIKDLGHKDGIIKHGHCWSSETREPTVDYASTELGKKIQTGSFTSHLEKLKPGTRYYVRGYAENAYGVSYGETVELTTAAGDIVLTTLSASDIFHNEATCGGRITDLQGNTITELGVCWNTSASPTLANHHASSISNDNTFSVKMTGLTPKTIYYARAYATSATGKTYYGKDIQFTTPREIFLPQCSGSTFTDITTTTVTLNASVTNNGDGTISDAGFCYATTTNPTTNGLHVSCGPQTGAFKKSINGLTDNTKYYVRAYVVNERGTNYGSETSFTTLKLTTPQLSSVTMTDITYLSATFKATITSTGNGIVSDAGFVYDTKSHPDITCHKLSTGSSSTLQTRTSNLTPATEYYVRAYAVNEKGIAYSEEITFRTKDKPYSGFDLEGFGNEQSWDK